MNKYALMNTFKSKFFLTIGAILITFATASAQESRALSFMYYNDSSYSGNCSGYYVNVAKASEAPVIRMGTARHCLGFSKSWSVYPYGLTVKHTGDVPNGDKYSRSYSKSSVLVDGIDHFYDPKAVNMKYYFALPETDPQPGASLRIFGYPMGIGPKQFSCMLRGYVMRPKQIQNEVENGILAYVVCLGANIQPGISGGPVLNARNEVVGTISAKGSNVIAFYSPNYLAGLENIKMWKIVGNKFVEDSVQYFCFSKGHRMLPLSSCN